jgi:hypothetical protein
MAVLLSISARDIGIKILAIWFPTATFVALAMDHIIANMFFVPIRIWSRAPSVLDITLENFDPKNPRKHGGGLFVDAIYWYLYVTGEGDVLISFNTSALRSAIMEDSDPIIGYNAYGSHGSNMKTSLKMSVQSLRVRIVEERWLAIICHIREVHCRVLWVRNW